MSSFDPLEARHFVVRGRVQGVGFRYFVQTLAEEIGVKGWVRNRADGSVEVYGEAPPQRLADFRRRLERGPSLARVDAVEESAVPAEGTDSFQVRF